MAPHNKRIKLVYILAASHSGSTLLAFLLAAHPEIVTVGELKLTSIGKPETYRCSCREFIKTCPFWTHVKSCMAQKGFRFDIHNAGTDIRSNASSYVRRLLKPLHRGRLLEMLRDTGLFLSPNWRANYNRIQQRNLALIQCISELSGKRIIVDSSKIGIRLKYLKKTEGIDLRVVRLVRDGRGVALTYMDPEKFADAKDPSLRGGGIGQSRLSEQLSLEKAANEWKRSNEEGRHAVETLNEDEWIQIKYEDLCKSTEDTMKKIFRFLGTESEEPNLSFKNVDHHVVGNGMRLDTTNEIVLDDRWQTQLSKSDLDTFDAIAGFLNRELGYQ